MEIVLLVVAMIVVGLIAGWLVPFGGSPAICVIHLFPNPNPPSKWGYF
jgi:hypothetical protein